MSDTPSQSRRFLLGTTTVTVTQQGSTYRVHAHKDESLSQEDYIQLQILEHQLRYGRR
jgi:hypothetical protein